MTEKVPNHRLERVEDCYLQLDKPQMNIAEPKKEMDEILCSLELDLSSSTSHDERSRLVENARQQIERTRKSFKNRIDSKAQQKQGFRGWKGFSINERAGLERKLLEVTETAVSRLDDIAERTE